MANPSVLSAAQSDLLRAVIDRIVPASDRMPAASSVGVVGTIEAALAAPARDRRTFVDGLSAIELRAWESHDRAFVTLASEEQDVILRDVEREQPDFFELLVRGTYRGYYRAANVKAALGVETRPPQPLGFTLPALRSELLEPVRARGPVFRKVDE